MISNRSPPNPPPQAPEPSEEASSPEPTTQRRRTSNNDATQNDEEGDYTENGLSAATQTNTTLETQVKKLVRFALASELNRKPIRRPDINEKCLGTGSRAFKEVFAAAQLQLRDIFGMEMQVAPAKDQVTLAQKRAAQRSQTQATQSGRGGGSMAGPWFLVSTLPPELRGPVNVLKPTAGASEEDKYRGIYTVLCSLISLSNGSMPENKLSRYLRRLMLEDSTPLAGTPKPEALFKRLEKDGYIVKVKESTGGGEDDVSFTLGPRGKVEVGEAGVRGLVGQVYDARNMDDKQEEELVRRIDRSMGVDEKEKRRQKEDEKAAKAGARQKGGKGKGRKRNRAEEEEEEEEEEEDEDDEEE